MQSQSGQKCAPTSDTGFYGLLTLNPLVTPCSTRTQRFCGWNKPSAQNMEGKRPKRVKTEPKARHVDGHTLKAMGGLPGQGCPLRRTAEIEDYGPAPPPAVAFNEHALHNGKTSGILKKCGAWVDEQGVAIIQLNGDLNSKQVVLELDERFKDGKLSFAAKDQIAEFHTVKGGWLTGLDHA